MWPHALPLHEAIIKGDHGQVKALLMEQPTLAVEKDAEKLSPAHTAVFHSRPEILATLLDYAPSLAAQEPHPPLDLAVALYDSIVHHIFVVSQDAIERRLRCVMTLLDARPDALSPEKHPAVLFNAVYLHHVDLIKRILDIHPAFAETQDSIGSYPLHLAAELGRPDVVRALLEVAPHLAGARNGKLETPLHSAASSNTDEVVELILKAAPETATVENADHKTPLHLASAVGNEGGARLLLDAVPYMASRGDSDGCPPVWLAAQYGHPAIVAMLLRVAPQSAAIRGRCGMTAVHAAADSSQVDTLKLLLRCAPHRIGQSPRPLGRQHPTPLLTPSALCLQTCTPPCRSPGRRLMHTPVVCPGVLGGLERSHC